MQTLKRLPKLVIKIKSQDKFFITLRFSLYKIENDRKKLEVILNSKIKRFPLRQYIKHTQLNQLIF